MPHAQAIQEVEAQAAGDGQDADPPVIVEVAARCVTKEHRSTKVPCKYEGDDGLRATFQHLQRCKVRRSDAFKSVRQVSRPPCTHKKVCPRKREAGSLTKCQPKIAGGQRECC